MQTLRCYGGQDTISSSTRRHRLRTTGHPGEMEDSPVEDRRLYFIADYVLRTLKLKQDKWQKFLSSEENRQVLQDFVDKAERGTLVVSVTAAGLLQAAAAFTASSKNKAVYFVKRSKAALSPGCMKDTLVYGDLSSAPLDQFTGFIEEVSGTRRTIGVSQ